MSRPTYFPILKQSIYFSSMHLKMSTFKMTDRNIFYNFFFGNSFWHAFKTLKVIVRAGVTVSDYPPVQATHGGNLKLVSNYTLSFSGYFSMITLIIFSFFIMALGHFNLHNYNPLISRATNKKTLLAYITLYRN